MDGSGGGLQSAIIRRRPAEAGLSAMENACAAKVPLFGSAYTYLLAEGFANGLVDPCLKPGGMFQPLLLPLSMFAACCCAQRNVCKNPRLKRVSQGITQKYA
ncbi:hypothetical protein IFR08_22295 [Pseudomonas fluorescens]|uniref:hypothetical protein n=1 Tax=Pseudomonas fluorescens TaxID=294 RepID=UPI00177CB093|nr:hypothetical protein [Pseudomonas fluorescens]MBD8099511.1 hypothetical protein [Pseudomonas fluorescens]MBD8776461.1 hypothetical protein [Pseudomonas fluorescens]MBD8781212.1 hypothetical protein [Pseudomonas fluorescens]MBD8798097.1 hypothetical protein [Pseudomonas fluorescens]